LTFSFELDYPDINKYDYTPYLEIIFTDVMVDLLSYFDKISLGKLINKLQFMSTKTNQEIWKLRIVK
jgi:hypothetical protein